MRFSDEQWLPEDQASATIGVDFRVIQLRKSACALNPMFEAGAQDGSARQESQTLYLGQSWC